ncbi:alpha/beta fold hydrolase [Bacillus sp. B-jedd]|uniref:alpha/beta fold hydrolase n=1 Tax=Bacillus sp. B-jedd TaxID=1476857 RepID=UPI00051557AE|nr:alpha/beta hydrolase [Bacillus sp. B-jedd]CEG27448.1 putative hydrolase [Bacillus sp. B-jedd]
MLYLLIGLAKIFNVRDDLTQVKCPVLGVTGEYDIQADPGVLKKLPEYVKGDASFTVIENMGHSCKYIEARSTPFSAKKDIVRESALPLHPDLERILKAWLEERFPA